MNPRAIVFSTVFLIFNFLLIPMVSLYGIRVCPVLTIPGFWFGCIYTGVYMFSLNALNIVIILLRRKFIYKGSQNVVIRNFKKLPSYVFSYVISGIFGLITVKLMLANQGIHEGSRAPQILILLSFLLGVIQAYGMNWVDQSGNSNSDLSSRAVTVDFRKSWFSHVLRLSFPLVLAMLIVLHFLTSQSAEIFPNKIAPVVGVDLTVRYASFLILFVFAWLLTVYTFHFLSEKDFAYFIHRTLTQLSNLNSSNAEDIKIRNRAWGLWAAIIYQLEEFLKVFTQRERLLKSFSQFVTSEVASKALNQELSQEVGERKTMTVIFVDIRDFTQISESLPATRVVYLLNNYFSKAINIFNKNAIIVDKFIGDGILAYVESLESDNNAELQNTAAVKAVLELFDSVNELNEKFVSESLPKIKIGCGIHRGELVAGIVGAEIKLEHTIIGDTVNRVTRLEGLCKRLNTQLVISDEVCADLNFNLKQLFENKGRQDLRGISDAIEVYALK